MVSVILLWQFKIKNKAYNAVKMMIQWVLVVNVDPDDKYVVQWKYNTVSKKHKVIIMQISWFSFGIREEEKNQQSWKAANVLLSLNNVRQLTFKQKESSPKCFS